MKPMVIISVAFLLPGKYTQHGLKVRKSKKHIKNAVWS